MQMNMCYCIWHSVERASWYICVTRTNTMHFFSLLICFSNHPLRASNRLTIHHQEALYCICSIWYLSCTALISRWHTICCMYSKVPPDDEQLINSKHVEDDYWNKLRGKSASCCCISVRLVVSSSNLTTLFLKSWWLSNRSRHETYSFSAAKLIRNRDLGSRPLDHILSQFNPFHAVTE
jgi:hypothetical protein